MIKKGFKIKLPQVFNDCIIKGSLKIKTVSEYDHITGESILAILISDEDINK